MSKANGIFKIKVVSKAKVKLRNNYESLEKLFLLLSGEKIYLKKI